MKFAKIVKRCRVDKPNRFRLDEYDPGEKFGLSLGEDEVKVMLAEGAGRLRDLQDRLYAQDRWALLIILQGMDAAGKDGTVEHVLSGINPRGCDVHEFKAPSEDELQYSFFWRAAMQLPRRGRIGIFNRSYYEEVLVVRVHPKVLEREKLPPQLADKDIWKHRYQDIRAFERHLDRNGTRVLKFHLRISKEEQRQRFLARLDEPNKRWKLSAADIAERGKWDHYMKAYEEMIRATSTEHAPWYVIPADHKHVAWLVVAAVITEALEELHLDFPTVEGEALKKLKIVEEKLRAEKPGGVAKKSKKSKH
jgi:PPK2 family polyphosphate:nucleotide phosphotransferase